MVPKHLLMHLRVRAKKNECALGKPDLAPNYYAQDANTRRGS